MEETASCAPLSLISSDATESVLATRTQNLSIIVVAIDQYPLQEGYYKTTDTEFGFVNVGTRKKINCIYSTLQRYSSVSPSTKLI